MINLEGKNFLIVEDEDMNFIYLKQIFKLTKGNVDRVKTGESAIRKCKEKVYDFILMDIQLPDMTGMEATKTIREFNPSIPIIAQSAIRTQEEIDSVLEAGCNDVLTKPFKLEDFSEKIRKFLS